MKHLYSSVSVTVLFCLSFWFVPATAQETDVSASAGFLLGTLDIGSEYDYSIDGFDNEIDIADDVRTVYLSARQNLSSVAGSGVFIEGGLLLPFNVKADAEYYYEGALIANLNVTYDFNTSYGFGVGYGVDLGNFDVSAAAGLLGWSMDVSLESNVTADATAKDGGTSMYTHFKAETILFDSVNVQAGYFSTTFSSDGNFIANDEARLGSFTILAGIDF